MTEPADAMPYPTSPHPATRKRWAEFSRLLEDSCRASHLAGERYGYVTGFRRGFWVGMATGALWTCLAWLSARLIERLP